MKAEREAWFWFAVAFGPLAVTYLVISVWSMLDATSFFGWLVWNNLLWAGYHLLAGQGLFGVLTSVVLLVAQSPFRADGLICLSLLCFMKGTWTLAHLSKSTGEV